MQWAWVDAQPLVLQARPMTALPEPPPRAGRMGRAVAALVAEVAPVRPYLLDATSWFPNLLAEALAFVSSLTGVTLPLVEELFVIDDGAVVRFGGRVRLRPAPTLLRPLAREPRLRHLPGESPAWCVCGCCWPWWVGRGGSATSCRGARP